MFGIFFRDTLIRSENGRHGLSRTPQICRAISVCFAPNCLHEFLPRTTSGEASCFGLPRARSASGLPLPFPRAEAEKLSQLLHPDYTLELPRGSGWGKHCSRKHTPAWLLPLPRPASSVPNHFLWEALP